MKRIISVWFPNFSLDRFKRDVRRNYPGRAGTLLDETLPFALIMKEAQLVRIAAANRGAREGGVRRGMALADAHAVLPSLKTCTLQPGRDRRILRSLAAWCTRYAPWTNVDGDDGLWLDVTGAAHLFGGEDALLRTLGAHLHANGFENRLGLARTPGAAWALARFCSKSPNESSGARAHDDPADDLKTMLAPFPVEALRLAPDDIDLLHRLGLKTIGQLSGLPRSSLARRFPSGCLAETLLERLDQVFGLLPEPISPAVSRSILQARQVFAEPCLAADGLGLIVRGLLDALCRSLEAAGEGARALVLAAYRSDASMACLAIATARPSRDPAHLMRLFDNKLQEIDPGFGIDAFVLTATRTETMQANQPALTHDGPGRASGADRVDLLVDRLSNRLGEDNVYRIKAVASHIPERSECSVRADAAPVSWPCSEGHTQSRPLRLFAKPERIEAVAALPDGPPRLFRWRRILHHVVRVSGPERILPEWWHDLEERQHVRDYYEVEDKDGRHFWIFRERLAGSGVSESCGSWHMHGLFA